MRSRTAPRGTGRRLPLVRVGAVVLASLAASGLVLPAAEAATGPAVDLDAPALVYGWNAVENGQPWTAESGAGTGTLQPVAAAWGGTLTLTMPPQLVDAGHVTASLLLEPAGSSATPTKSYSWPSTDPTSALVVTALGGDQYRVVLPADDGTDGPVGVLRLSGFAAPSGVSRVQEGNPPSVILQLSATAPAAVSLAP